MSNVKKLQRNKNIISQLLRQYQQTTPPVSANYSVSISKLLRQYQQTTNKFHCVVADAYFCYYKPKTYINDWIDKNMIKNYK